MKTSNKIILSFLTFAWLSFMATLLISHQFADYDNIPAMRRVFNKVSSLESFSVVKIDNAAVLRIIPGDSAQLHYDEIIGDGIKPPKFDAIQDYEVKNDTLFIKNMHQASNGGFTLEVVGLKHLIVNNATEIDLVGFSQDSLRINAENSTVRISKKSAFSYLQIATPQKFNLSFASVKDFNLELRNSQCTVSGSMAEISGVIGNYAELIVPSEVGNLDVNTSENGKVTVK